MLHTLLQLGDLIDFEFEDLVIIGGEETVYVLFEGNSFRDHEDLILLCRKTNEQGRSITGSVDGIRALPVDYHQSPLGLIPCLSLKLLQSLK